MRIFGLDYLLLQKSLFFNILLLMMFTFLEFTNGWLFTIFMSDISYISIIISILTLVGIIVSLFWSYVISKETVWVKNGQNNKVFNKLYGTEQLNLDRSRNLESLKLVLGSRIAIIRYIAWSLVILGLIGTVIGFIVVLLSIDPSLIGDVERVPEVMASITSGLGIALYTTLLGSIGNLWLNINFNMIQGSVVQMYSRIIKDEH